jgi:hypothetical protein
MFILITFRQKSRGYSLRNFLQALSFSSTMFKHSAQHPHIEHLHSIFVLHTHTKYAKI